jgi:lysophospholipase L1-like esterase
MRTHLTLRRLAVVLAATACVAATTSCSGSDDSSGASGSGTPASSSAKEPDSYLALGDSVPFGYRAGAADAYSDPKNFVGYPQLVGDELGLDVINAACPGETTTSFLDAKGQSNGCENSVTSPFGYRTAYPLHVQYDSPDQSQLNLAVKTLKDNDNVKLVTVQIGANDGFVCQQTTPDKCTNFAELQGVAETVQNNVDQILKTLRKDAGYDGQIVVVTYYALNYSDPTGQATKLLDDRIASAALANAADVADGFAVFQATAMASGGDSIAAGLVLPNDVHPTEQGQKLLSQAVLGVVK